MLPSVVLRVASRIAVFAFVILPSPNVHAGEASSDLLDPLIQAPEFRHAHWGILVADLASGEVLYELDADKLLAPASTTKLFSVAAALTALGPDYRFETPLYARGSISADGALDGDLILVASGDLTLGGRTDAEGRITFTNHDHTYADGTGPAELTEPDALAGLNELARQVAAAGIKRIHGAVLIDDRLFEAASSTGSGPQRLTPIMVNDNLIDIVVAPTEPGSLANVTWRPMSGAMAVEMQAKTVAKGFPSHVHVKSPERGRLIVHGTIAVGHSPLICVHEISEPAAFARDLLIEALGGAGVAVELRAPGGDAKTDLPPQDAYSSLNRVATLVSPPFSEEAKLILKVSHNLHASTLPLLLAARDGKRTLAEGLRLEGRQLESLGVDADTISFGGGAGGDRADFVTPRATVQLLRLMAERPEFGAYLAALPVLGVDGTLANAVVADSPARGKVQAKTGTLYWRDGLNGRFLLASKALAGYMTAASGRRLAISLMVNNVSIRYAGDRNEVGRKLGRACEILYEAL